MKNGTSNQPFHEPERLKGFEKKKWSKPCIIVIDQAVESGQIEWPAMKGKKQLLILLTTSFIFLKHALQGISSAFLRAASKAPPCAQLSPDNRTFRNREGTATNPNAAATGVP